MRRAGSSRAMASPSSTRARIASSAASSPANHTGRPRRPGKERHGRQRLKLPLLCPSFVSGPNAGNPSSLGCSAAMDRGRHRSLSSTSSMPRSGRLHCSSRALPSPTATQPCRTRRFNSRCLGRQLPCPMPLIWFRAASSSTPRDRSAGPRQVRCPRPPLQALPSLATTIGLRVCRCL